MMIQILTTFFFWTAPRGFAIHVEICRCCTFLKLTKILPTLFLRNVGKFSNDKKYGNIGPFSQRIRPDSTGRCGANVVKNVKNEKSANISQSPQLRQAAWFVKLRQAAWILRMRQAAWIPKAQHEAVANDIIPPPHHALRKSASSSPPPHHVLRKSTRSIFQCALSLSDLWRSNRRSPRNRQSRCW